MRKQDKGRATEEVDARSTSESSCWPYKSDCKRERFQEIFLDLSPSLERRIVIFRKREYLKRYFEAVDECFFGVSETGDEPFLLSEPCQYFRVNTRTDGCIDVGPF